MRCGAALTMRCPVCGTENPLDAHFCVRCGAPLAATPSTERRVVTVLFADLVESTPLAMRLDPEPMRALIADYFAAMRDEVERHGGIVEKFIGDAVMAVFGLPAAHEDDPMRSVRAAIAMRQRLDGVNRARGGDLRLRIGVTTGEVVADPGAVRTGEFLATGEVVNLAARLQQGAAPNTIVVDERTADAVRHAIELRPLAQDGDGEVAARPRWEVVGLAPASHKAKTRMRAPMLGREGEMQFLHALYRRVVDGRRPHLVTVMGAAGAGKSRLAKEFIASLDASPDRPHVLRGRCPAYGEGLTYWPIAEILKQEFRIQDSDPAPEIVDKVRSGVHRLCDTTVGNDECDTIASTLAPILGVRISAGAGGWADRLQAFRRAAEGRTSVLEAHGGPVAEPSDGTILRALRAVLAAKAATRPLIIVIEDLHWAEQSLLTLLEQLATRGVVDAPVLALCLARPELLERDPHWGGRVRNYTAISLAPLSDADSKRLVKDLLRGEPVPADVRDAILGRAEGNPFFIQELLRMLVDGGSLVRGEHAWQWASQPVEIRIPDTIHGTLASRLDLLSALEKRVAQDAALIGRVFWTGALIEVSSLHAAEVRAALERLQEREVVEERSGSSLAGERQFAFTHALIREVAYASLPKAQRSAKHVRFAQWLERAAGADEEFLAVLAHHYEQAWRAQFETGEPADASARQAVTALRRAGARATSLRTLPEARRLYDRALAVVRHAGLDADLPLLLEVLTERCEVAKWMSAPDVIIEDTEIVLRRAGEIQRDDLLARAWLNRAFAEYVQNHITPAEDALRRALDLFGRRHDDLGTAEALEILGIITEDLRGKLTTAHDAYRRAFDLYRRMEDGQGMARSKARLGRSLLDNGRLHEARGVLADARALARTHHERLSDAFAVTGLAIIAHLTGADDDAQRLFHEAIALRHELGNLLTEAYTRVRLAMHYLRIGRLDDAERELRVAAALRVEHGMSLDSALVLRGLAEVALARGDLLTASEHAERGVEVLPDTDALAKATHVATLARIRAAQGRREEALTLFEQSIAALERREYPIDLALALLKFGDGLALLGDHDRSREVLGRARALFAQMGATRFAQE
jgi:class 3 adenylate cyclase/tetratricopeptide (TPR) repeat protein